MKVMTFNTQHCLNYITNEIDFETMARVISDLDADVVGLNEMRGLGTDKDYTAQVEKLAQLTGMQYFHFAKAIETPGGPYGNGILSKFPIKSTQTIAIPDPKKLIYNIDYYETRCILKAEIEGITFLVTHIGLNPDEKINAVCALMDNINEEKCILMGDFNMTPNDPILQPIFSKMTDTAKHFNEDKRSFPSDDPTIKIDYILTSPDAKILSADIPKIVASDHRPHTATIEF